MADLRYVFEGSRVSGLDGELLAEGLQAVFGRGRHAGVQKGFDEPFVLIGRHVVGADEVGDWGVAGTLEVWGKPR